MAFYFFVFLSLAAGAAVSMQGLMNVVLRAKLPLSAVIFINTLAGLIGALIWFTCWKLLNPNVRFDFSGNPFWLYCSGFLGLLIVIAGVVAFPKLGVTWALTLMILGQLALGLLADHYGWFGIPKVPLAWPRMVGAAFVLIGCWLTSLRF